MTIDLLCIRASRGDYTTKKVFPEGVFYSLDHVFDVTKGADWNKKEVRTLNRELKRKQNAYWQDIKTLNEKYQADLVAAIVEEYPFTEAQAKIIVERCWTLHQSYGFEEVAMRARDMAEDMKVFISAGNYICVKN